MALQNSKRSSSETSRAVGRLAAEAEMYQRRLRVVRAAGLVLFVLVLGTLGFYQLTDRSAKLLDCLYMTVVTVSTVGFHEVIPVSHSDSLEIFVIVLLLFGVGAVLYFLTALTAMLVEDDLRHRFWRRRMQKRIEALNGHVIVAGAGRCGGQVVRELRHAGTPLVVVELDPSRIELLNAESHEEIPSVVGDALEDAILRAAGIDRARGLVATLHEDRDNLFLCLSARQLNAGLRIASKVDDKSSFEKFEKVGVNAVVSPPVMGGRHLVSEMLRPEVATFVDGLLRVTESAPGLVELRVDDAAEVAGQTMRDANLRTRTNCLILGIRGEKDPFYIYNPGPDEMLQGGASIIALGDLVALERLRGLVNASAAS